jgi:hypothetical protein
MAASQSLPTISSPLAGQSRTVSTTHLPPQRASYFPTSRSLRPFPSVVAAPSRKPVKMIQPPANQRESFVLNLTQAEFSRQ